MSTFSEPRPRTERLTRLLLLAAIAVPFVYFGTLLVAGWFYPGYSHATRYASELGSAGAPWPWIFNAGILTAGLASIAGGLGFHRAVRRVGGGRVLGILLAVCLVFWGVGLLFGALFPMPDERHGGFGLGLAIQAGPLLAALAFRRAPPALRWIAVFLWVNFLATTAMFSIMMGAGAMVTYDNVGLFQRGYALTTMPWIGLAAWGLLRWQDRSSFAPS